MKATFNNRLVEIVEIANLGGDPVDAFIEAAYYLDTEADLTEEEIELLSSECDFYEECMEYQIVAAEAYMDNDR